jgi:hypothetical protein
MDGLSRVREEVVMDGKRFSYCLAALLALGLSACGAGVSESALEKTIAAGIAQTQTMQSGMENGVEATLTALAAENAQAASPNASATLSQAAPIVTTTTGNVSVTVSVNTWCNKGPGSVYDRVFIFYVGQTAKVIGKDQYGNYWVIEKPDNPAVTCWLWGKYATITGDPNTLPVIPAPPTPTPPPGRVTALSITVDHPVIHCTGSCHMVQSWTVTITTDGPATVTFGSTFSGDPGCNRTMTFTSAGTQSNGNANYEFFQTGTYVIKAKVCTPNIMTAQAGFQVVSP